MSEKEKRAWMIVWFSTTMTVICICLAFVFYRDGREIANLSIMESNYIKDARAIDGILTERDKYLKVTSFYAQIAAAHWARWSPVNNNKPKKQGLTRDERARLYREIYEVSSLLGIPLMSLPATISIESSGIPRNRTEYEAGLYQHRYEAVNQANTYFNQLPDYWKKRMAFYFNSMDDLLDPINATRIEAVLVWGSMKQFGGDPSWYITAKHWGLTRIHSYYKNGVLPPREFKFNVGTIREDIRQPFTYYFAYNEYLGQFSRFNTEVMITTSWLESYRKEASKMEWEFIELQRDVMKIRELIDDVRKEKTDFEEQREAKLDKIDRVTEKLEDKYRELNNLVKRGRFKNIKEVYLLSRQYFKEMMGDIVDPKIESNRKMAVWVLMGSIVVSLVFSIYGFVVFSVYSFKVVKLRILRKKKVVK